MNSILSVENFKCFSQPTDIQISSLTLCTGMNSVGKSTLIQALLLMRQTKDLINNLNDPQYCSIPLNTDSLKLGSTNQIMSTSQKMKLSIDEVVMNYSSNNDKLSLNLENIVDIYNKLLKDKTHSKIFNSNFYYLNSERLGPRNYQELISRNNIHCGYHGEYTFDVISKKLLDEVNAKRRFLFDEQKKVPTIEKQIEYWLGYVTNGVEVNFSSNLSTQLAEMKVRQSSLDTPFCSPYNFGFGISYVLPIITTGLIAENDSMVIVENPEAHLHPAGQSRIGEFLAHISTNNVQVIIETHSEHVINGIRKYALKNKLDHNDICINYFDIDSYTHTHTVRRLPTNNRMDILEWPEGFFDQEEKDLKELRILRSDF